MNNYLREVKAKYACPLCKKPLTRRELEEAPKVKTIADAFRALLADSSRIQAASSSSQQGNTKKRKLNDFMKSPQGNICYYCLLFSPFSPTKFRKIYLSFGYEIIY